MSQMAAILCSETAAMLAWARFAVPMIPRLRRSPGEAWRRMPVDIPSQIPAAEQSVSRRKSRRVCGFLMVSQKFNPPVYIGLADRGQAMLRESLDAARRSPLLLIQ